MDFLSAIVPNEGESLFTTLQDNPNPDAKNPKKATNYWYPVRDERTQAFIDRFQQGKVDLYYSMATYRSKGNSYEGRLDENVHQLQALWLDIDAGATKFAKHPKEAYPDYDTAYAAVQQWLDDAQMWEPSFIVSSGEGLHIYWALANPVSPAVWRSLSAGLRQLVREHGLKLDAGVSMRMSGILRVPGTIHVKSGKTVTIISDSESRYTVDQIREAIPFVDVTNEASAEFGALPEHMRGEKTDLDEVWETNNQKFSMAKIMDISLSGQGCNQMKLAYEDQQGTTYHLWRGALAIAATCIDGDEWIHKISNQHSGYDPAFTEKLANKAKGMPFRCQTFEELDPEGCRDCPYFGNLKSPIVLGKVIEEATPEQILKLANEKPKAQNTVVTPEQKPNLAFLAKAVEDTTVKPLALPRYYTYASDGGLIRSKKNGEQDIIYRYPLLLLNRVYSQAEGEALIIQCNLPNDEPRIFQMPLAAMVSDDKLKSTCAQNGVIVTSKEKWIEIMSFLRRAADEAMDQRRADRQHQHYGWTDDMTSFVVGNTEYGEDGSIRPMVLPQDEGRLDKAFTVSPDADIDCYLDATDLMNVPGLELSQFVLGVGLAAPLFKLLNIQGCLVHCWAPDSGVGKTTTAQLSTAIWGRPVVSGGTGLMALERDTATALYIKLGQLNSVSTMIDEITKRGGDELSDMVYAITQGRDKDRGQAQANKLRDNQGSWSMAVLSTGNLSVTEQLIDMGSLSEALNARVIELNFSGTPSLWGENNENKALVETLFHSAMTTHAGTVGRDFIRQLLANRMAVQQQFYEMEKECADYFGFTQKERFWNNTVCCALLALRLGNELDYWQFDIERIKAKLKSVLGRTREKVESARIDGESLFSIFLATTLRNRVVVNTASNIPATALSGDRISIREESDTGLYKISKAFVRAWCHENKHDPDMFERQLLEMGAESGRGSLSAGASGVSAMATEAIWIINMNNGESNDD